MKEKKLNKEELKEKLNTNINISEYISRIKEKIMLIDYNLYENNLKPFLNDDKQKYLIEEK